ncbi:DUF421 domain-containing protein [Methylobacterium goesingense]|uniref:Uncharacterized membrane protein YcaP (DUF421 family) n=1 Tax=Methylobacterium goesingense TaxID=243690 RepID=A0ABV2L2C1_9HYPH|nr:YetF domain-containing protein [Methylobacterium goesingense]GJD75326.1 hypothetical protein CFIICLFH_3567 [Methylobacterium goesingense]
MFFDSWSGLLRVVVVAPLAYVALILFLRISGKRTLTKLNAFDLVVTVALGSTLSSIVLTKSVALLEGVLALATLIGLQYAITWSSVRSARVRSLIKAEPTLLAHKGHLVESAMRRQRLTRDDVLSALRSEGLDDLSQVAAVVLETDGSISVLKSLSGREDGLDGVPPRESDQPDPSLP